MYKNKTGEFTMLLHNRLVPLALALLATAFVSGCDTSKGTSVQDSIVTAGPISDYDLSESVLPFPNDLLLNGTTDGTINIPVADETDLSDPQVALNALDGFSTVAPMSTGFSEALSASSINGTSVRVYEVVKGFGLAGPVTAVTTKLVFGVDYVAAISSVDSTNSTLVILPLKPLKPKTSYAVLVTDDLTGTDGKSVAISSSYLLTRGAVSLVNSSPATPISNDDILVGSLKADPGATQAEIDAAYVDAATLDGLRAQVVNPSEAVLVAADADAIVSNDVILHWVFTTLSTTDVMAATRAQVRAKTASAAVDPVSAMPTPQGAGNVHFGTLDVPYYLLVSDTSTSPSNDPTALGSCWEGAGAGGAGNCAAGPHVTQYNPAPTEKSVETIPLIVTVPVTSTSPSACVKPAGGWPVVIFQHGITRNRGHVLAVSDSLALACLAAVAIDIPMHGVAGTETDGTAGLRIPGLERHFDLDLVTQDANGDITAAVPDGIIDSSGAHFVNLTNLLNTRDNLRQAVSDLFVLVDAIEEGAVTDGTEPLDTSRIYYYGYSLGSIAGTVFTAMEPNVRDSVFVFGGTGAVKILDGSFNFGPALHAGLAANGVVKGTADYESFLGAAQTVVDAGDSVNFSTLSAASRGILFNEIVGGNSSPSDLTVPNTVPDANDTTGTVPAPLAGTEPQLALMGLTQVNATVSGAVDLKVVTKFISGYHGSLVDPSSDPLADPIVTTEIQTQAATFFVADGQTLLVTDDSVLQPPPVAP
jgi:dienelactone hydrolase